MPQAAVGALANSPSRCCDPVQIEPVVELPDTLTHAICRRLGLTLTICGSSSASICLYQ
jgi:hypothetical protein